MSRWMCVTLRIWPRSDLLSPDAHGLALPGECGRVGVLLGPLVSGGERL